MTTTRDGVGRGCNWLDCANEGIAAAAITATAKNRLFFIISRKGERLMVLVDSKSFSSYKIRSIDIRLSTIFEIIIDITTNSYGFDGLFRGGH